MLNHLLNNKELVTSVLIRHENTRNNDKLLWLAVMVKKWGLKDLLGETNYKKFRALLLQERIPTFESISRLRRKIQEQRPELSGDKRQREEEAERIKEWSLTI